MEKKSWIGIFISILILVAFSSIYSLINIDIYKLDSPILRVKSHYLDIVNLIVICPLGIISVVSIFKGSNRAKLVAISILAYALYMYGFNSLSLGFNRLFLIYISIFGLSIFSGVLGFLDIQDQGKRNKVGKGLKFVSIYLLLFTIVPALAWISEITTGMILGVQPDHNLDLGITVNVVHVFDLAFTLPLLAISGVNLLKGKGIASGTISTFFVLLISISILVMEVGLLVNNLTYDSPQLYSMFLFIPLGIGAIFILFKEMKNEKVI